MYQELEMWKAEKAKQNDEIVIHKDGITTTTTVDKVDKDELLSAALAECFAMNKQFTNVNQFTIVNTHSRGTVVNVKILNK